MSDREHWDAQVETAAVWTIRHASAMNAAWSEPEERTEECIKNLLSGCPLYNQDGRNYIDLGAGCGRIARPLQARNPLATIWAEDISPNMLNCAGLVTMGTRTPALAVIGEDEKLGHASGGIDGVYSMLMFQHITNEQMHKYIDEVARVLKHDGWFRFQFVTGSIYADYDRRRPLDPVLKWLKAAKLSVRAVSHNLMYDDWCWITCIKA